MRKKFFATLILLMALLVCTGTQAGKPAPTPDPNATTVVTSNCHIKGSVVSVGPQQSGVQVALIGTVVETGEIIAQPTWFRLYSTRENQLLATALVASTMGYPVTFTVSDTVANSTVYSIYINVPQQ